MKHNTRYVNLNGRGKVLRQEGNLDRGCEVLHANQTDSDGENIFIYGPTRAMIELTPRQAKRLAEFITEVYKTA